jgi:hypothetical protein
MVRESLMIKWRRNLVVFCSLLALLVGSSCGGDAGSQSQTGKATSSPIATSNANSSAKAGAIRPSPSVNPSGGSIQVISTPPGAAITLIAIGEGFAGQPEPKGATPVTVTGVTAGKYTVDVEKPGYRYYQKDVVVKDGQTVKLTVPLKKE